MPNLNDAVVDVVAFAQAIHCCSEGADKMPTINISGKGPGGGPKSPPAMRAAGFDAYQAQQEAAAAAAARYEAHAGRDRVAQEKQIQAAWAARNRQEQEGRRAEAQLLKQEMRTAEAVEKNRARASAEAKRAQQVMERADRDQSRRQRSDADYENRNYDLKARKQQRATDYQARADRAAAEFENRQRDTRNPFRYVRSGIGSIGAGGAAAARGNDPVRAMFSRAHLGYIERNIRKRIAAGGPQAAELRKTLEAVGEARAQIAGGDALAGLEGGGFGKVAGWAALIADAGSKIYNAPDYLAGKMSSALTAAAPYTNLLRSGADLGGAGGFNGRAYAESSVAKVPAWRRRLGITAAGVYDINSAYGVSARSGSEADSIAHDVAAAGYAPGLQGIPREQLASMAGRYASAGGAGSRTDYFTKLKDVMTLAVAKGVDRSAMGETIARVQGATAGAGGAVDMNASANLVGRLMSAGNSGMRTGAGVAQGQAGLLSTIAGLGFGGSTMATMALAGHIGRNGGMKAVGTQGGLEALIGRKRADMSGQDQAAFDDALAAAKGGASEATFLTLIAPLMASDQGQAKMIGYGREFAGTVGMPGYMRDRIAGAVTGTGQSLQNAYSAGRNPASTGPGWSGIPDRLQNSITAASGRHKMPPAVLAGLLMQESTMGRNMPANPGGANGYGGIERATFNDVQKAGLLPPGYTYSDASDPDKGPEIAAAVYEFKRRQGNGSVDDTLQRYYGTGYHPPVRGVRQPTPAEYSAHTQAYIRGFSQDNLNPDLNANEVNADQGHVLVGKKNKLAADAVGSDVGGAVLKFDAGAASFSKGVETFVAAASELYRQIHAEGRGPVGGFAVPTGPHAVPRWSAVPTP